MHANKLLSLAVISLVITGCRTGGPTDVELRWFDVSTNHVEVVTSSTNLVNDPVTGTDVPLVVTATNMVEEYTFTPSNSAKSTTYTASNIANIVAPGSGTLVGALAAGLWGLYGTIRSRRTQKVAAGLVHGIEVIRQVLSSTPEWQAIDAEFVRLLKRNATEAGVAAEVAALVQQVTSNPDAKAAAALIENTIRKRTQPEGTQS